MKGSPQSSYLEAALVKRLRERLSGPGAEVDHFLVSNAEAWTLLNELARLSRWGYREGLEGYREGLEAGWKSGRANALEEFETERSVRSAQTTKPHIARGDSPLFTPVYDADPSAPSGWKKVIFDDWVCGDHHGFFGRGSSPFEAFNRYKAKPRHPADTY